VQEKLITKTLTFLFFYYTPRQFDIVRKQQEANQFFRQERGEKPIAYMGLKFCKALKILKFILDANSIFLC
jgi:hypothetical protein